MKKINFKPFLMPVIFILIGLGLGRMVFHTNNAEHKHTPHEETALSDIWTCSMHPQIKSDKPGLCPICAMELIPLKVEASTDSTEIELSEEAIQLANVQTTTVGRANSPVQIQLYGKVQADERLLQSQVSHVNGRIDRLMVNYTGETVRKGQLLAVIYSPEWLEAQQEFLETVALKTTQPELYRAAKHKLQQWMITDKQIAHIESGNRPTSNLEVYANTSGVVIQKRVNQGDYIQQGSILFEVADLRQVWVLFDAYESDLPYIKTGDRITFRLQSIPNKTFTSTVKFIDPVVDPASRVVKIRIEIPNQDGQFKPEMYATGSISGKMDNHSNHLSIPRSAVLWTGKRSIVYVKTGEGTFRMQEIEIGPVLGNENYAVLNGLHEGDEIVINGTFQIDAAAQLEGKNSMMNQTD